MSLRSSVWLAVNGEIYKASCFCCGLQEVTIENFQAGHIIAAVLGGPATLANLKPICSQCNQSMGVMHMYDFATSRGFPGRIVKEPRLEAMALPRTETKERGNCRGCGKSYSTAYLKKLNGYCQACMLIIVTAPGTPAAPAVMPPPVPSIALVPVGMGVTEVTTCCHCKLVCGVIRR